ncbi:MAG: class II aldolase/adducin family protein [Thermoplasmata archaeon]|nr:class II aldolase/adducin family protein [Thermoplasmata archaeon]
MNESYARKQLVKFCSLLYDRELTVSAGGNMSIRLNEEEIVITPSGKNKGLLDEEELLIVSMDGEVLTEGKPSIETGMHLALYKKNQNTGAIVHCHPLNCVALTLKKKIRTDLTPEGVILLGDVPTVGYYTPGTDDLANAVASCADSNAILMERHGAVTQGRTIEDAYNRMEELEFQAKLQMLTGRCRSLPKDEIERLKRL